MRSHSLLRLDNQLCFALYAASRAMTGAYRPLLDELGVTYPQYLAMLVLWEVESATVKELGQRLYLDSGTLTPLLKRLEGAGLISRERRRNDEREVLVSLTAQGRDLRARAAAVPRTIQCSTGLTDEEIIKLRGELKHLLDTLESSTTEKGETP